MSFGRASGAPVRGFDGKASVMTQNRQAKEEAINRLHAKTFSAWVNVHLRKRKLRVKNVIEDFGDGILLIQLLEVLADQPCPFKYNKAPKLEIQKVENVSVAVKFINQFARINVNPKDIVSGNAKVILATLWRLIVTFQMANPQNTAASSSSAAVMKREAKSRLLGWVQQKTGAELRDCDRSFDDGAIFCLLVHAYNPDLIDVNRVHPERPRENLEMAFQLIEQHLNIPRMLSPEDMVQPDIGSRPDEQCVMTYLSQFPSAFLQRPTPKPMEVTDINLSLPSLSPSPVSTSGGGKPNGEIPLSDPSPFPSSFGNESTRYSSHQNIQQPILSQPPVEQNRNVPPATDSFGGYPQRNHMGSEMGFQAPVEEKSTARYSIGNDIPLPPTVAASDPPASSFSQQQKQEQDYYNSPLNTNANSFSSNPPGNGNTFHATGHPAGPHASQFPSHSNPYQTSTQPQSFGGSPMAEQGFGTFSGTAPQRPPPPSGFEDFVPSIQPAQPPRRPPAPSSFGDSFNAPQTVPGAPSNFSAPPDTRQADLLKEKEAELRKREADFQKQQEEFMRAKREHEQQVEDLKRQSLSLPQPTDVTQLQNELEKMRTSGVAKLTVQVISARNLLPGSLTGTRDPYAIVIVDNQKEKTTVAKRTIHPNWNVEFIFYVDDPNWVLNVTIYDRNKLKHDPFLGKVVIPIRQLQEGQRRDEWLTLQPKKAGANVSGEIRLGLTLTR